MVNFQESTQNQALNILLIDNDFEFIRKILKIFKTNKSGNGISVVNSGLDALDYMLQIGKFKSKIYPLPDIILMDLNLPDINGFSLLSEIKHDMKFLTIPIIILGASLNKYQIRRSYMLGAASYIYKPEENGLDEFVSAFSYYWSKCARLSKKEDHFNIINSNEGLRDYKREGNDEKRINSQ